MSSLQTNNVPVGFDFLTQTLPDSEVHGANMGPTWVLSAPDGPHVGPTNLAIRTVYLNNDQHGRQNTLEIFRDKYDLVITRPSNAPWTAILFVIVLFNAICIMMTSSKENIFRVTGLLCGNSPVTGKSRHRGQWRGARVFSLIYAWTITWANNEDACDLRRHSVHHDVIVMRLCTTP